ncbi:hypothetical protein [Enterococcus sp. AZ109]
MKKSMSRKSIETSLRYYIHSNAYPSRLDMDSFARGNSFSLEV